MASYLLRAAKSWRVVAGLAHAGLVLLSIGLLSLQASASDLGGAARAIDGDTLEIRDKQVRLYGLDAPERGQTCFADRADWHCGLYAAQALREKIRGTSVHCRSKGVDRYGRVLAVCSVGGENLNQWMVRQGWALAYRRYALDYVDEEMAARSSRQGIWRGAFVAPWRWRTGWRMTHAQSLRSGAAPLPAPTSSRWHADGDRDCADFRSQAEAQAFFSRAGAGDPHHLDGDGDGIACEGLR